MMSSGQVASSRAAPISARACNSSLLRRSSRSFTHEKKAVQVATSQKARTLSTTSLVGGCWANEAPSSRLTSVFNENVYSGTNSSESYSATRRPVRWVPSSVTAIRWT